MHRSSFPRVLPALGLLAACGPAIQRVPTPDQPLTDPAVTHVTFGGTVPDTGVFVVTLGTDTTIIERYVLHAGGTFETIGITRVPQTVLRRTHVRVAAPARIVSLDLDMLDVERGLAGESTRRSRFTFEGDSAVMTVSGDQSRVVRMAGTPDMLVFSGNSPALHQLVVARALASPQAVDTVWLVGNPPQPHIVRGRAPGSVTIETPNLGTWEAQVDARGRILSLDMGLLGTRMERTDWRPSMEELARSYAARDAAGTGLGVLSPRDTVRARIGNAALLVDYGRPARRGRVVFGGLVPFGETWRTGANEATHLTTDRDIELGGTRLPAGTYTLWTVPGEDGWTLIVNSRTGQWGTVYDADYDVLRVPMRVTRLPSLVERFTIGIAPEGRGGVLRMRWEETEASVPFRVVS